MNIYKALTAVIFVLVMFSQALSQEISKNSPDNKPYKSISSSSKKASSSSSDMSQSDIPKFVDTGDYEKDMENYRKAKAVWIEKYPDKYKNSNIEKISPPEYVDTGNPEHDKKVYKEAKEEFVRNNSNK